MKLFRCIFISIGMLLQVLSLLCMDTTETSEKVILAFDVAEFVSRRATVSVLDFSSLIPWTKVPLLMSSFSEIHSKGKEFANCPDRTVPAIDATLTWLEEVKGHTNIRPLRDRIVEKVVNPVPSSDVIEIIRKLKMRGYCIIGVTNQDVDTHIQWRKKMKEKGFNPSDFLNAVLVTAGIQNKELSKPTVGNGVRMFSDSIFEALDPALTKTDPRFFALLTRAVFPLLEQQTVPTLKQKIIYTGTSLNHTKVAIDSGLEAIMVSGDSPTTFFNSKDAERAAMLSAWKTELSSRGISF
jgi:hypothetical protein